MASRLALTRRHGDRRACRPSVLTVGNGEDWRRSSRVTVTAPRSGGNNYPSQQVVRTSADAVADDASKTSTPCDATELNCACESRRHTMATVGRRLFFGASRSMRRRNAPRGYRVADRVHVRVSIVRRASEAELGYYHPYPAPRAKCVTKRGLKAAGR